MRGELREHTTLTTGQLSFLGGSVGRAPAEKPGGFNPVQDSSSVSFSSTVCFALLSRSMHARVLLQRSKTPPN